ncbi:SAM-dependent methyltransferase, type 12 [uncultured Desulfobacterium sp.]|uniref:SAM-dependent methyltransferase, type 12 n=1 Tax=uncultured Desulfobacterium sp. TaxID=201089 RepID=A0A445MVG9_9BACT|nr:SAM-dependent methyltransferase, type 12 [uncultured Desulfobacterium sp.]
MSNFEESRWADKDFSQGYRDDADIILPFRVQFIEISISLYEHFISQNPQAKVMDLGCGDGLFIQELTKSSKPLKITLVDGSAEMLAAAKRRLSGQDGTCFIKASFQQLLANDLLDENFDFIYSSLAMHHLTFDEKKKVYAYIYEHLIPDGWFIHYDVALPPSDNLEKWYLSLWRKWIKRHSSKERQEQLLTVPDQYKDNPDNVPDTLGSQLKILKDVGFINVDCFYKYGLFSLFGGSKQGRER